MNWIFSVLLLELLLLIASSSAASTRPSNRKPGKPFGKPSIKWGACQRNFTAPIDCGSLSVALDYTDKSSKEELDLSLLRLPASKKPFKGSILINFGGPGESGVDLFNAFAEFYQILTGGHHDLIHFEPRGTGNTIKFECFSSPLERTIFQLAYPLSIGGRSSNVAIPMNWARTKLFADTCNHQNVENKKVNGNIGTAFVARDMMQIVDALNEDGMLRYWGISYGTLLGTTVAAMFPKRIDKVILDAVVNPYEYYHGYETEILTSSDKVFSGLIAGCVAAPQACPLARDGLSAAELEAKVYKFLEDLKVNPVPLYLPGGKSMIIDYDSLRALTFVLIYGPAEWPILATLLDAVMTGNFAPILPIIEQLANSPARSMDEQMRAIKCSDSRIRTSNLSDVLPTLYKRHELSKIGGDFIDTLLMTCAQWRLPAKERPVIPSKFKTKNPILIINSRYDHITPLVSAQNVTASIEGSRLLTWNGYGHSVIAQGSSCVAKATRTYWTEGKLPKFGTVCEVEVELFSGSDGWAEAFEKLGLGAKEKLVKRSALELGPEIGKVLG